MKKGKKKYRPDEKGRLLSPRERQFLEGKFNPNDSYELVLKANIRKKTWSALEDLTLVFDSKQMDAVNLHLSLRRYYETLKPFVGKVLLMAIREHFYEDVRLQSMEVALSAAGKEFDKKRFIKDQNYRWNLASWYADRKGPGMLVPGLEERDQKLRELERDFGQMEEKQAEENKVALELLERGPGTVILKDNDGGKFLLEMIELSDVENRGFVLMPIPKEILQADENGEAE